MVSEEENPVAISALQHYSYCPRQCALIHIEQAFEENVHTMRGHAAHLRVDEPDTEAALGARIERALPVWSERLGLVGRCDVVEFYADGTAYPVEYKHGPRRMREHDDVQLAAQAVCLQEMTGLTVPRGAIFHVSSRRRREVLITDGLKARMEETLASVRAMLGSGIIPPPVNDERCRECSLRAICQPEALAASERIRELMAGLYQPDPGTDLI
ncbi:MAG: CRISPR-associated protein Cas4 [Longimicrobiales bacterium]